MTTAVGYALGGLAVFLVALYGLLVRRHVLRKIVALNIMGSGVFLVLVGMAGRSPGEPPDPVPQAIVLTGIVVTVGATALALALTCRVYQETGSAELPEDHRHARQ